MSLDASAMLGSSLRGGPPVGAAGEPLHARFLEIAGVPLGLENYGNTCYLNSVIQLLYHCAPIRLRLLELQEVYASKRGGVGFEENTVLFQLCQLFTTMHKQNNAGAMNANKKQSNSSGLFPSMTDTNSSSTPGKKPKITPSEFLKCVKMNNAIFNNSMQQDAHEFVLYLLNDIIELEQKMMTDPHNRELFSDAANYRKKKSSFSTFWKGSNSASSGTAKSHKKTGKKGFDGSSTDLGASLIGNPNGPLLSPLQAIIQGTYASVTVCLECNHMTTRDEVFMDVSVGTKPGSSLTNCIQHMGDPEYFFGDNKLLKCDGCGMKQFRAAKTIHVERLPQYALLVHLKRFRYDPSKNTFSKQSHHVALPIEMDVEEYEPVNEEDDEEDADIREQARRNQENSVPNDSFRKASDKVKRKLHGLAKHKARFELAGFVAHLGEGPNSGHYFTCVRCGPQKWRRLDDENVTEMTEREVQQHFGVPIQVPGLVTSTAYILLYERVA
ncbi:Ubiquitin carboxyl-terminal hydrolase, putative [Angomonas deanei]|uniref:Ubiquitin carboxyl-terminal hydrolase n=1 Tax=Angomonas deanei TaxID=59799 RepID=A0A7G2CRQ1_9TRYP|nr:Ubiquitin carboxyl-terminal hydrolase, putative [Angomonas deanei]